MDIKVLIGFLVFSAVVYILRAVFGSEEQNPQRPGPRPQRPINRPRQTAGDMERFLEEINRRRREAASGRPTPPAEKPPQPAPPRPRPVEPVRRTVPTARRRPGETAPRQQPAVVEVVAVEEVPATGLRQAAVPAALGPGAAQPAAAAAPQAQPTMGAQTAGRGITPLLRDVTPLLRAPQSLRNAILLQEIFGPPMCHRGKPTHFGRVGTAQPHGPIA